MSLGEVQFHLPSKRLYPRAGLSGVIAQKPKIFVHQLAAMTQP